jgi:hypothetical protein
VQQQTADFITSRTITILINRRSCSLIDPPYPASFCTNNQYASIRLQENAEGISPSFKITHFDIAEKQERKVIAV